jgi:hypothetical protein
VGVHRSADVEEQQDLDAVAPLGLQLQVEPAGIACRPGDRAIEIELLGNAFACKAPQPAQRDLDVAGVELDVVIEVAECPLVPDLDGGPGPASLLPDAYAFGVVAVCAEWTRAAGADPFAAALMALALLGKPLPECLHQLVEPAQRLDRPPFVLRKVPDEFPAQPVLGDVRAGFEQRLYAIEVRAEREVETVEMLLVLYQAGARENVEVIDRARHDPRFECLEQRQELPRRYRQPERLQVQEEIDEHCLSGPIAQSASHRRALSAPSIPRPRA